MRNKILIIIALIFFVAHLTSCKKYLDEKSNLSLIIPEKLEDLQGILDDNSIMNTETPGLGELSSDDYFALPATFSGFDANDQKAYVWQKYDYTGYPNSWSANYNKVYNANYCLEKIEKVQKTQQNSVLWNNIKGSALFFRAYSFLSLAWEFSKAYDESTYASEPGIVLRLGSDFNVHSIRSNVKQVYEQIVTDLKESIQYLPDYSLNVMRPSKTAAYALLARTYLSMRKYNDAYEFANLSLQLKHDLLDYNSAEVNAGATVPFKQYNTEIVFYTTMTTGNLPKSPSQAKIDSILFSKYGNGDKRRTVYFRLFGGYQRFKGSYAAHTTTLFTGIAVDEVYLIRAECNVRSGRIEEAMNDLNTLLIKRHSPTFIPLTASSAQEALDIVLMERRKELLMRGIRWSDIKRLNKESRNIVPTRVINNQIYTLTPNEDRYALPLPTDIVTLTGIPQNTGW